VELGFLSKFEVGAERKKGSIPLARFIFSFAVFLVFALEGLLALFSSRGYRSNLSGIRPFAAAALLVR